MSAKYADWACTTCTFLNSGDRSRCSLCDAARPASAVPKQPSQPSVPKPQPPTVSASVQPKPTQPQSQPQPQLPKPTTNPSQPVQQPKPKLDAKPEDLIAGDSIPVQKRLAKADVIVQPASLPKQPVPVPVSAKPQPVSAKPQLSATTVASVQPAVVSVPSNVVPTQPKPAAKADVKIVSNPNANLTDAKAIQEREKARRALEEELQKKQQEQSKKDLEARKVMADELKHKREQAESEKKATQFQRQREEEERHKGELEERQKRRQEQESKMTDIPSALKSIQENYDISRYQQLCVTVASILKKIMDNPKEPKYKRIKTDAAKIQRNIVRPLGGLVIMRKLGFDEVDDHLVLKHSDMAFLAKEYQRFSQTLQKTGTSIPKLFSEIDKSVPVEAIYFAALELRNIIANVVALPDERNFRCVDKTSRSFVKRLKPIAQTLQVLTDFGFQPPKSEDDIYWVVEKPDISKMEAGVNDLNAIISQLAPNTPIARATVLLIENNGKITASRLVEKLQSCIHKIITEPHEQKYHKIKLDKFFAHTGPIAGGKDFFSLLGFQVHLEDDTAQIPYPQGFDPELLKLRTQDLHRAWKAALIATRTKRQQQGSTKPMDLSN